MMSPISRVLRHWLKAGGGELKGKVQNCLKLKYDYCFRDEAWCFTSQHGASGLLSTSLLQGFLCLDEDQCKDG